MVSRGVAPKQPRLAARAAIWLVAGSLVAGCATLPESGPVVQETAVAQTEGRDTTLFTPPGPGKGESPEEIVNGFMVAMQANPASASTARRFLSRSARTTWNPEQSTIVYDARAVDAVPAGVQVLLSNAVRLDSRGGWQGRVADGSNRLTFGVRRERGEWRITNPPNALILPASDFSARYAPYTLYFVDETLKQLVPERVYLARGADTVSSLVRALLGGPGARLRLVAHSEFSPDTTLGLSVLVGADGSVEVPLSEQVRQLPPDRLQRGIAQLAWTLGQISGLRRLTITVGDQQVPLPDGSVDVSIERPGGPTPLVAGTGDLFALRNGRLVRFKTTPEPVNGPFGRPGFALGSFGVNLPGDKVAAVSVDRRVVFIGPLEGRASGRRVYTGTRVLKPVYDRFGGLWLIDRTAQGAKVVLIRGGQSRVVSIEGISGSRASGFAVSRDGTALAAVINPRQGSPKVVLATIRRNAEGRVTGVTPAWPQPGAQPDVVDLRWVAFSSSADLILMGSTESGDTRVLLTTIDGSPGRADAIQPDLQRGRAKELVVLSGTQPATTSSILVLTAAGSLAQLADDGRWEATESPGRLTAFSFAG